MAKPRIYTRTGDDGSTGLYFGGRVRKDDERVEAYGAVDEAQAFLGVARASAGAGSELDALLLGLERDLWTVMAELATESANRHKLGEGVIASERVDELEALIDDYKARFDLPAEFVVPGEDATSAALDVARTVVRRAERRSLAVAPDGSHVVRYLNRLSDLLWTMARWQEGGSRLADPDHEDGD
ncbi:MAG: cob(I)alamin adenosyltransferase [Actinomycetota bacterium]|jgi:cob(I)alamin adenosyltransferase